MATFILTYNPDKWDWPVKDRDELLSATARGEMPEDRWSTGTRNSWIAPGDRWWLFQQGPYGRGLLASGRFLSECYRDEHWSYEGRLANYADVAFEVMLASEDLLPIDIVASMTQHLDWQHMQGSGVSVPDDDAEAIDHVWTAHVGSPPVPRPHLSKEDARLRVWAEVRRRQGQPTFRAALLRAYGGACAITGCSQTDALEAAHISPYRGPQSNRVDNGLLLRADLHTLFDLGLWVLPTTTP